jgi:hypothetical protein
MPNTESKMNESAMATLFRRWSGLRRKRRVTLPKPTRPSTALTFRQFTKGLFNRQ